MANLLSNLTMTSILDDIAFFYNDLMENKSDPRVKDWPLMDGPLPTLLICVSFAYFVKNIGPKLMEKREPFKLTRVLIVYNFLQILFSSWLFYESVVSGWFTSYSFRCQPVDYSNRPLALRMARGCWWYYISKFTEFLDTIFFVLRKKNDHISTLHVIHHSVMPLSVWFGVKFTPGGHSSFFGMLNTFVHIIMYTYYMFAAMGPQYQKYLWWKKYLTTLQMVQFVLVMVHAFQLLFIECDYPKAFVWWIGLHAVMFYFLFADFYKKAYIKKQAAKIGQAKKREEEAAAALKQNGHSKQNGASQNGHTKLNGQSNGLYTNGNAKTNGVNATTNGTSNKRPFFTNWANICQMDHSLLYEDDVVDDSCAKES